MCSICPSKYIGRKVNLEISEPWDFRGDLGGINVPGVIHKAGVFKDRIWAAVHIKDYLGGDVLITSVLVRSRYAKGEINRNFGKSNAITVNLSYDPKGGSVLDLDIELAIKTAAPYAGLIGSISLARPTIWERFGL